MKINNKPKKFILDQKFGSNEPYDDLNDAIKWNGLDKAEDIKEIVLEVPGENDGPSWWWIVKMKDKKYRLLTGGCDYTGWDCRSFLKDLGYYKTINQAIKAAPEKEEYESRNIREILKKQYKNELVFGTY